MTSGIPLKIAVSKQLHFKISQKDQTGREGNCLNTNNFNN